MTRSCQFQNLRSCDDMFLVQKCGSGGVMVGVSRVTPVKLRGSGEVRSPISVKVKAYIICLGKVRISSSSLNKIFYYLTKLLEIYRKLTVNFTGI